MSTRWAHYPEAGIRERAGLRVPTLGTRGSAAAPARSAYITYNRVSEVGKAEDGVLVRLSGWRRSVKWPSADWRSPGTGRSMVRAFLPLSSPLVFLALSSHPLASLSFVVSPHDFPPMTRALSVSSCGVFLAMMPSAKHISHRYPGTSLDGCARRCYIRLSVLLLGF